jgi:predicted phosphoadenosine phosphosulfate sulfurtransferase
VTDLQMKYIYNHVIIPHIDYKAQFVVWSGTQVEKLDAISRHIFKRKVSLPLTTPNSIIHSSMGIWDMVLKISIRSKLNDN